MLDKAKIKEEVCQICNDLLKKYDEPFEVDSVSVMNASEKIIFLGHLRVFNEDNVSKIKKELENSLNKINTTEIRDKKVIPCCSLPYTHISYHITFKRE